MRFVPALASNDAICTRCPLDLVLRRYGLSEAVKLASNDRRYRRSTKSNGDRGGARRPQTVIPTAPPSILARRWRPTMAAIRASDRQQWLL